MANDVALLTAEEEAQLAKIIDEDSDIWTAKGYGSGVLCEDAETPVLSYSSKAEKNKRQVEKIVEMQTDLELSKRSKALKLALVNYDANVLQEAREIQRKYDALILSRKEVEDEYNELRADVSDLRKKRNSLKSQKKKLEAAIKHLEEKVMVQMQQTVETLETKTEEVGSIRSLEI